VTEPLELFDALERIRVPLDVAVTPDASVAAFCAPARPDPASAMAVHLVDVGTGEHRTLEPPTGYRYALSRFDPATGELVVASGVADGELEAVVALDRETGAARSEVAVAGAVEDLVPLGNGRWVARIADPGSERDGMHLGTRVESITRPLVLTAAGAWRRLVSVDLGAGTVTDHPTPGWTIWDLDAVEDPQGGVALAVASREPSPAGYYSPALIRLPLDGSGVDQGSVEVLHEADRQLARPKLDGRSAVVLEGRSIVAGPIRRIDPDSGHHRLIGGVGDTTDLVRDGDRWWTAGWHDRGSVVGVGPLDAPARVVRIDGTIHGRDGQPSIVPIDAERCLAVVDTPERPAELCTVDMVSGEVRALTHLNDDAITGVDRVPQETVAWHSDGHEIRGGFLQARDPHDGPRPLVVFVHGGPTWLWSAAYSPAESNQLVLPVASRGAHVLLPNPRGSSGRGLEYADAIAGHVGDADVRDLLSGVDHLVERGLVDPDRIAVVGTS